MTLQLSLHVFAPLARNFLTLLSILIAPNSFLLILCYNYSDHAFFIPLPTYHKKTCQDYQMTNALFNPMLISQFLIYLILHQFLTWFILSFFIHFLHTVSQTLGTFHFTLLLGHFSFSFTRLPSPTLTLHMELEYPRSSSFVQQDTPLVILASQDLKPVFESTTLSIVSRSDLTPGLRTYIFTCLLSTSTCESVGHLKQNTYKIKLPFPKNSF